MVHITNDLPGSSSSSSTDDHKYDHDVFLSFRGLDTRIRFTAYLKDALQKAGYKTFFDDEDIEDGEPLKPELENGIKSSRASIIVLSENYAFSRSCLEELVLILDQKDKGKQIVIPVFYDVEPTNVKDQKGSFKKAMKKHKKMEAKMDEEKKKEWGHKIESWKMALIKVGNLKGKATNKGTSEQEPKLIEKIVKKIGDRLREPLWTTPPPQLIGMEDHIKRITSWIKDGSKHTADIFAILGIRGIGKTSLAKYVYQLHRYEFTSSFVEDISKKCAEKYLGLRDVQVELCADISKTSSIQVHDVSGYTSKIENAVARKKVLLVLDDINSCDQLDALLGKKGFCAGSKIIITTTDADLIKKCALFKTYLQPTLMECTLDRLPEHASLKLLCHHAFMRKHPKEGYEEVSRKLLRYCDGHPLALNVLGKSLYTHDDVDYWKDVIANLDKEPQPEIVKVLQVSYESLPFQNVKDLFKYIACFFVGVDRDFTKVILDACGMHTTYGIRILIDRCLLSIERDNKLMMHSLIQEIGRYMVDQESPKKSWMRSLLWRHEESFNVLNKKKGTESLLGLSLDMKMLGKKKFCELVPKSFSHMDNLKLLQLNYVQSYVGFHNFPEELRWLCMHGFPLKSIQLESPMENLVALDMSYSNTESFVSCTHPQPHAKRQKLGGSCSKDKRLLGSLKILDLSFCEQLCYLGGFFELPKLEKLIVRNCIRLIEVSESVEHCVDLVYVDLSNCSKLNKLPSSMHKLTKVKTLLLDGCNFSELLIKTVSNDIKFFEILPRSLKSLSLANSNLSDKSFPDELSSLAFLEELCLDKNPIVSMPSFVRTLPKLEKLKMEHCEMLRTIKHPPHTLRDLLLKSSYDDSDNRYKTSLRKIKLDPEMSPLNLFGVSKKVFGPSIEFDGFVKIQPMAGVKEKALRSLGWTDSKFTNERKFKDLTLHGVPIEYRSKMFYEFGIFSTFYEGYQGTPNWIKHITRGPSISFTIPSSRNKLRGLNFYCLETKPNSKFTLPFIKITNITENYTWIYKHHHGEVRLDGECFITLLSHWMFGPNEMKDGDRITIEVASKRTHQITLECGIGLVFNEDGMIVDEEKDVLGYYKSWNHIIGRDLSAFQITTGEYFLDNWHFTRYHDPYCYSPFTKEYAKYKEQEMVFKAFFRDASEAECSQRQTASEKEADYFLSCTDSQYVQEVRMPKVLSVFCEDGFVVDEIHF